MRDPARIERILAKIREVWHRHPDLRIGQLIGNLTVNDPYHLEDEEVERRLDVYYKP